MTFTERLEAARRRVAIQPEGEGYWHRAYRGKVVHYWIPDEGMERITLCGLFRLTRERWKHGKKRCPKCVKLLNIPARDAETQQ